MLIRVREWDWLLNDGFLAIVIREAALQQFDLPVIDEIINLMENVPCGHEAPRSAYLDNESGIAINLLTILRVASFIKSDVGAAHAHEVRPDASQEILIFGETHGAPSCFLYLGVCAPKMGHPSLSTAA
jgi:hypothetical protein